VSCVNAKRNGNADRSLAVAGFQNSDDRKSPYGLDAGIGADALIGAEQWTAGDPRRGHDDLVGRVLVEASQSSSATGETISPMKTTVSFSGISAAAELLEPFVISASSATSLR
jgi:hypothetical protein